MKKHILAALTLPLALSVAAPALFAQDTKTAPPSEADKEAFYATAIENRTVDILKALNLADAAKSNAVHDVLVGQYHELRVRDAAIDTRLRIDGKEISYANRESQLEAQSRPLHDQFLAKLAANLTPDQVDQVKDLMTYNKVKVTYSAYCQIVPGLTDVEKAKIMELLLAAREEAIDGGNAPEKSAIFQKYKNQINTWLDAQGLDTAKAFRDWAVAHPVPAPPAAK